MRLLSANMLVCIVKGCANSFPLQIVPTKVEQEESEPNLDLVLNVLPRLEWAALCQMAKEVCFVFFQLSFQVISICLFVNASVECIRFLVFVVKCLTI